MSRTDWSGDEFIGWGEPEEITPPSEVSAEDSFRVLELMRQVSKGRYTASTLLNKLASVKGIRPVKLKFKSIPAEIRKAGNRWGVTYDIVQDLYLVWGGGEPHKGYSITYTGEVKPEWELIAADIIRNMPNVTLKPSSFSIYFGRIARRLGYKDIKINHFVDSILQGRLRAAVAFTSDGRIEIVGGKGKHGR